MWEPSQATSDKDINGLVLLASAGCRLFGERIRRETVYVLCGGKGTAPGCALQGSPKVPSVQTEWHGAMRVSTTSSGAGATSRIAVIVQTGCGFLSGGRRGATYDDKEDCYGRATVALTRAIESTYIVSPPDMAGLIGMAQTLGVYHYGYFTLNKSDVEYHGPTFHPSDQTAVLEWGLSSPFTPQDG